VKKSNGSEQRFAAEDQMLVTNVAATQVLIEATPKGTSWNSMRSPDWLSTGDEPSGK
jgi:hypothetical protein